MQEKYFLIRNKRYSDTRYSNKTLETIDNSIMAVAF